jgi:DNA modification methylase
MVVGDARSLPVAAGSVQCVVTSPPYWGLRDYGVPGQLGLESTPDEYVANMVAVFREVWRVLRDDGTLWLNLGDSYANTGAGSWGSSDKSTLTTGSKHGAWAPGNTVGVVPKRDCSGLKPKDLVGIPWRVAFALQADGWYLRQDIIWAKPNPMPESVRDRCTKAHEYLFLLTKRQKYYYDAEAIAEPSSEVGTVNSFGNKDAAARCVGELTGNMKPGVKYETKPTRNRRSVWTVNTQPYAEAHFATFPEKLVEPCVLAGTSARGCCPLCRTPWVRVVESRRVMRHELPPEHPDYRPSRYTVKASGDDSYANGGAQAFRQSETIGWRPDCFCMNDPANDAESLDAVPCLVLDPFAGSGTVGAVCRKLARRFVGVELNPKYVDLARARMARVQPGLALEVG